MIGKRLMSYFAAAMMAASSLLFVHSANAAVVSASLPDINIFGGAGPYAPIAFGPFVYAIPGDALITSASLEGTYGTAAFSTSTAGFDAVVNGALVTVCVPLAANCWQGGPPFRAFSIPLPSTIFASLLSGTATLSVTQTNPNVVRFGTPTLKINYERVPEPTSIAVIGMALLSLLGLGLMRRRADA